MVSCQAGIRELPLTDMGPLIKEARNEAGLTMEGLAEKLDLSKQTVKEWEAGRRQPTVDNLRQLAAVLGKSPGWFLDGSSTVDSPRVTVGDLPVSGEPEPQELRMLDLLAKQQQLLADQQAALERQRQDHHAMMERQRQDVSRLTELLARQQEETIAEREFSRRFAVEQMEKVQLELASLRRDFDGMRPAETEQEKLAAAMVRLEAAESLLAKSRKLPPAKAREAAETAAPAER